MNTKSKETFYQLTKGPIDNLPKTKKHIATHLLPTLANRISLYKKMPIDDFLEKIAYMMNYDGLKKAQALLDSCNIKLTIQGIDNIPSNRGCIITSNHPLGLTDGAAGITAIIRKTDRLKVLATDKVNLIAPGEDWIVTVNTSAGNGKKIDNEPLHTHLKTGNIPTLVFPSGNYSIQDKQGKVEDGRRNRNFIIRAIEHNLPIIPMKIGAQASNEFYQLAHSKKPVGLGLIDQAKAIMLGLLEKKGETLPITFGNPIDLSKYILENPTNLTDQDRWFLANKTQEIKTITHNL